ncbi:MAG: hypothetical protein WCO52_02245 [bacterium]
MDPTTDQKEKKFADWYRHPKYIGRTGGPVGGGCFSCGCAVVVAILVGGAIIAALISQLINR